MYFTYFLSKGSLPTHTFTLFSMRVNFSPFHYLVAVIGVPHICLDTLFHHNACVTFTIISQPVLGGVGSLDRGLVHQHLHCPLCVSRHLWFDCEFVRFCIRLAATPSILRGIGMLSPVLIVHTRNELSVNLIDSCTYLGTNGYLKV